MKQRISQERRILLGFAALCLLNGSSWILGQFWTSPLEPVQSLAVRDGVMAALLLLVLVVRRVRFSRDQARTLLAGSLWGAVLFTLPALIGAGARGQVEQFTTALVYVLTPVVVLFLVAQRQVSFGLAEDRLNLMLPTLAGFGGAALLFPFRQPDSVEGLAWLVAVLLAAGLSAYAAVRLHDLVQEGHVLAVAAGATAISALAAALVWAVLRTPLPPLEGSDVLLEGASLLLLGLPAVLLVLWLVGKMTPVAFSSRYLLVPAVTILEGLALLRPQVTWTTPAGLTLIAGAGWILLHTQRERHPASDV